MENQVLSLRRLGIFLKKYLIENKKNIILSCLSIIGLPILLIVLYTYTTGIYNINFKFIDPAWDYELRVFSIMLTIWAFLFGSKVYAILANKNRRIEYLTSPASNLEKFLTTFIIYIIGFTSLAIISFFIADWLRVLIVPLYAPEAHPACIPLKFILTFGNYNPNSPNYQDINGVLDNNGFLLFTIWITTTLTGQAFFTLGSSVWPKNPVVKSLCASIVITSILIILYILGMKIIMGDSHGFILRPYFSSLLKNIGQTGFIWLKYGIDAVILIYTYWLSYLRFKEIETINRW